MLSLVYVQKCATEMSPDLKVSTPQKYWQII